MNKIQFINKIYKKNLILIFIFNLLVLQLYYYKKKNKDIKVALCTMGKKENLYAKEFIEYYISLGVDHLFIYDHNDPFTEKIEEAINNKFKEKVTIYEAQKLNINYQRDAFTDCYQNNFKQFDFFIMVDMDEYLFIINDTLKHYLSDKIFDKCDFIKIHWADTNDNDLIYYDPRPLFQRFKKPYIISNFIKTIIRGNIPGLKYWVHSPYISPTRNVTCTNDGKIIKYTNMNFEYIDEININRSYLIHFRFKTTEEMINKFKRGYSNWHGDQLNNALLKKISSFFEENKITLEKINYLEKELKFNLSFYKSKINLTISNNLRKIF